ncbi:MAG: tape measure protein [Spirochaetes bacterium]|nr:tape measure protein [Spirochaetota bacterium]
MAGRFSIEAVFKAVDKLSVPMAKMGITAKSMSMGMKTDFARAQRHAGEMSSSISRNFGPVMRRTAGVGVMALGAGIAFAIKKASEMENATASFTTMLGGNAEAAKKLVSELQVLGAETPFEFKDLQDASVMLMGFGAATKDNMVPTLKMLGDLSQGSADRLKGIALAFGQIKAQGKASLQDINQLINNQVPILQQLAKQWNLKGPGAVGQARQMIATKGTAEEIEKAMRSMVSEGGMFFNGMLRASATFTGLWSTFMDAIGMTAAGIGDVLLPTAKEWVITATKAASGVLAWVQANKALIAVKLQSWLTVIKGVGKVVLTIIDGIVAIYPYIAPFVPMIIGLVGAFVLYQKALLLAAFAQAVFNAASSVGPMGRMMMIIGAMVGLIYYLNANWDEFTDTTKTVIKVIGTIAGIITGLVVVVKLWAIAQIILNAALWTCPITWIIIGIIALVAAVILVIKYWDYLKQKFFEFTQIFDNPVFAALSTILFPLIAIPILIARNWDRVKDAIGAVVDKISAAVNIAKEFMGIETGKQSGNAKPSDRRTVTTGGERTATSIESKSNTQHVVIRNGSQNQVDAGGQSVPRGGSLKLGYQET